MTHIEEAIAHHLDALAEVNGKSYSESTTIRHTGGTDVVIEYPEGHKSIVSVGRLELMTQHLSQQALRKKAA